MTEGSALIRGLEGVVAAETRLCDLDGRNGRLAYGGYDIDELARQSSFEEVTYLLWHGELPKPAELDRFRLELAAARPIPPALTEAFRLMPRDTDPMRVLQAAVAILGMHDLDATDNSRAANLGKAARLTSQIATAICAHHRVRSGESPVPPSPDLPLAANFLYMLSGQRPSDVAARALDASLILYAEHELNASTFTTRVIAATLSDMHSAVAGGVGALKGTLHGGAGEAVMRTLIEIGRVDNVDPWADTALAEKRRLMGFGHRVYTAGDPRAAILRGLAEAACRQSGQGMWYDMAVRLHARINAAKKLIPNVDFYSRPSSTPSAYRWTSSLPSSPPPVSRAGRPFSSSSTTTTASSGPRRRLQGSGPPRLSAGWQTLAPRVSADGDERGPRRSSADGGERGPFEAPADGKQARMNLTQKLSEPPTWSPEYRVAGEEIGLPRGPVPAHRYQWQHGLAPVRDHGPPARGAEGGVTYIDHNVYQTDSRNTDDHRYLQTAARRYGSWFSKPGNGICHQVHFETFSVPGQFGRARTATPRSAAPPACWPSARAGRRGGGHGRRRLSPPHAEVVRVWLTGELPPWVHAKDVILELLRRYSVRGGNGKIFEYGGAGAATCPCPARHHLQHGRGADADHERLPSDEATRATSPCLGRERTGGPWPPIPTRSTTSRSSSISPRWCPWWRCPRRRTRWSR